MKSEYYAAVVTNVYRMAIDRYLADPEKYVYDPAWLRELESVSTASTAPDTGSMTGGKREHGETARIYKGKGIPLPRGII